MDDEKVISKRRRFLIKRVWTIDDRSDRTKIIEKISKVDE